MCIVFELILIKILQFTQRFDLFFTFVGFRLNLLQTLDLFSYMYVHGNFGVEHV
jgi:hypothetical protein